MMIGEMITYTLKQCFQCSQKFKPSQRILCQDCYNLFCDSCFLKHLCRISDEKENSEDIKETSISIESNKTMQNGFSWECKWLYD